jgi:hypothetical protein
MTGLYYLDGVGHPEAIAAYTASFAPTLNRWRSFTAEASAAAGASFLSVEGERGARRKRRAILPARGVISSSAN